MLTILLALSGQLAFVMLSGAIGNHINAATLFSLLVFGNALPVMPMSPILAMADRFCTPRGAADGTRMADEVNDPQSAQFVILCFGS